jgi:YVTN family beta-propeller protein
VAGAALLSACGRKAKGYPGYAFVANHGARSVAAVDLRDFTLARQLALEGAPAMVAAHAGRRAVYVLAPEIGTIYEILSSPLGIARRVRPVQSAVSMRMSADGESLWVLGREPRALVEVPIAHFRAGKRIALAHEPADFELNRNPESRRAAVSFAGGGPVALCDLAGGSAPVMLSLGNQPRIAGFRKDGKHLLVATAADRTMTIVDVATARTVVRLPLPLEPANFCVTADGGQIFMTGPGMDAVVILAPFSTEVSETILAGRAPANMAISGAPQYLFISNPETGDVTVLDVDTRKLVVVVHVGIEPRQIVFTPDNQYALVLNSGSGDMAVIRIQEFTSGPNAAWAQRHKLGALFTTVPVGVRPVGVAVV